MHCHFAHPTASASSPNIYLKFIAVRPATELGSFSWAPLEESRLQSTKKATGDKTKGTTYESEHAKVRGSDCVGGFMQYIFFMSLTPHALSRLIGSQKKRSKTDW